MSVTTVMSGEWGLRKKQTRCCCLAGEVVMPREAGYLARRCNAYRKCGRGVGFAGEVYLALVVVAPPRLIKGDESRYMGGVG
jgi:hypothetical protein